MGTTLSTLKPPAGAKHRMKRVGRGVGSGNATTAGRGEKGQRARAGKGTGKGRCIAFEGGQMPLQRRLPKRGFKNPFRVAYEPVNVATLAERFTADEAVNPETMKQRGVVPRNAQRIKILGEGEIPHALAIRAHAFSRVAAEKIQAAGGSVEVIPAKVRAGRPAAPQAAEPAVQPSAE